MTKPKNTDVLAQQWERAVEQAHENSPRQQPLSDEQLDTAAGLEIKSGVRAGGWTQSFSCQGGCTTECAE